MGNQQAQSVFTDKNVQMLVETSGKSESEIRQWYDEFHQESNGADRMNRGQFQTYYTKLRRNSRLNQLTDHIFRAFDTDHSGKILFVYFSFPRIFFFARYN